MPNSSTTAKTRAHCNTCGGERNHDILHSEEQSSDEPEYGYWFEDRYEMLKCCGCGSVKLRNVTLCSEGEIDEQGRPVPTARYYPPAKFRPHPKWFFDLLLEVNIEDGNIHDLLAEIYVALQNDQRALAAMGIRALLEKIMVEKVSDRGTFAANLNALETDGYVSRIQRERLQTILEAGHAAMHRLYRPTHEDLITLVDIAESVVESIYIHGSRIDKLKQGIPARSQKAKR